MLLLGIHPVAHMSLPTQYLLSYFMALSSNFIVDRWDSALQVEAQFGWLGKDYVNISNHYIGSVDHQYSWYDTLGTHQNLILVLLITC